MQSVAGLVVDDRVGRGHDLARDLLASVRRQAVHEERVGRGMRHELGVHLVALEGRDAHVVLGLVAHGGPGVGEHHVGALDGGHRVAHELERGARAVLLGSGLALGEDLRVDLEALGRGDAHVHAGERAALEVGVGHVVAVAHIGELQALERLAVLDEREEVGQDLAGVVGVGEGVDHRHVGASRDLLDLRLGEGAQHDAVVEVLEHLHGVLHRLAAREGGVVVGHDAGVGAQAVSADLEGVARTQRGLLHDDGHGLACQGRLVDACGPIGLLALGGFQDKRDLGRREVEQAEQVAAGKLGFHGSPYLSVRRGARPETPHANVLPSFNRACAMIRPQTSAMFGLRPFMQFQYTVGKIYSLGWYSRTPTCRR